MKNNLNILIALFLIGVLTSTDTFARRQFDKNKDLLLANFDLRPDKDDIHASAALACMLKHPDFSGVKYFVVVGAVGTQNCQQFRKPDGILGYFTAMFGRENQKWANAFTNWNNAVNKAKAKVVATINAGGKVFVQEGGPSEFTRDVLEAVNQQGISLTKIKNRVTVVQHSIHNEGWTTYGTKQWIRNNTDYVKIADGNSQNATPDYCVHGNWISRAKNNSNPNSFAKNIWKKADNMVRNWDNSACHNNGTMNSGGVDMSDCVENWWIFNLGNRANNMSKFWDRYVTNGNSRGRVAHQCNELDDMVALDVNADDVSEVKGFKIYPTKITDAVSIETAKEMDCTVLVYTVNGQVVVNKKMSLEAGITSLDVSELAKGTYIIKVQSETINETAKFLKIN